MPLTARSVLEALDPAAGGLYSGTAEEVRAHLGRAHGPLGAHDVRDVIERLVLSKKVERISLEDGSVAYARPDVLLRAPGVAAVRRRSHRR